MVWFVLSGVLWGALFFAMAFLVVALFLALEFWGVLCEDDTPMDRDDI